MPFLKCPQCCDWIQILGHGSVDVYDYMPCDRCIDKMDAEAKAIAAKEKYSSMIEHFKIHTSRSSIDGEDVIFITSHGIIYWSWPLGKNGPLSRDELKAVVLDILDRVDVRGIE